MAPDAAEEASIPNLGLRNDEDDGYRELLENLDDRLQLAKEWLDTCTAQHPNCTSNAGTWPRRVLELDGDTVYLREYAARPAGAEYIALSYCWGPNATFKTLKSNLQAHLAGLKASDLPRTLRDAVYVCAALDRKYIWIDALCIIQDDQKDWMDQIPMMANIYSDAALVIIALGSATVHDGCLELTAGKNAPFHRTEVEHDFGEGKRRLKLSIQESDGLYPGVRAHHSGRPTGDSSDLAPLLGRAWTFQERYLAKRVLFCTPSELSWECIEYTACECQKTPTGTFPHRMHGFWGVCQLSTILHKPTNQAYVDDELEQPMTARRIVSIWTEAVRQYSERMLTNWTDRLAAIHGAVVALTRAFPDVFKEEDYIFGMWKPCLVMLMTWTTEYHWRAVPTTGFEDKVPSWSWAKVAALIEYKDIWTEDTYVLAEVDEVEITMDEKAGFGAGSGVLTIYGFMIPTRGEKDQLPGMEYDVEADFLLPDCFLTEEASAYGGELRMAADDRSDKDAWRRVTHFMPLTCKGDSDGQRESSDIQGLFLEPVPGKQLTFRRVGLGYDYSCCVKFGDPEETKKYFARIKLE